MAKNQKRPPQELSVRDAYDLADAMGISITDLCGAAQTKMLEMDFSTQNYDEKNTTAEVQQNKPVIHALEINNAHKN